MLLAFLLLRDCVPADLACITTVVGTPLVPGVLIVAGLYAIVASLVTWCC
jgi:hypothetical protein